MARGAVPARLLAPGARWRRRRGPPLTRSGWALAASLALVWGLGCALPALSRGELLGQPFTDLYPAVWGLWWFTGQQPGLPTWCAQLGAPAGMPFYYSSPLHGWLAWPLVGLIGLPSTWNLLLVLARIATVLAAFGAGRAWGLGVRGALVAATVYGASPFFQGYAVEGIVEGTDGWALAAWLWAVGRRRHLLAAPLFALTVLSSWYMAACGCLLAALLGPRTWAGAAGGLALASPALWRFWGAFPERAPLDPAIRAAMGTGLLPSKPGISAGLNPFAKTSWVGGVAPILAALAARRRPRVAAAVLGLWILSLGRGPWYELPPLSALRFPYRLHGATLAGLAFLAGSEADRRSRGGWLAPLILAEGLLLSPIEPLLPGSPAQVPEIYQDLPASARLVLDIPGPVAAPPGVINRSRPRARWFLYAQTAHGRASPWRPDFNSVGVAASDDGLDSVRALDPLEGLPVPEALRIPPSVDAIVLHRRALRDRALPAAALLKAGGWIQLSRDNERWLLARSVP